MTERATNHFAAELDALVERFRGEYDITYAEVLGVLIIKTHLLTEEACDAEDEEGEGWKG